ncbi:MAG: cryptochrome/photolyase family protein [Methanomicrobiales archaeon]|nr:cryptochrome/photolyase family protein [Methanomicrobiales archaeon]
MDRPAALIFPHQLFSPHPCLDRDVPEAFIVEEDRFFSAFAFHKKKLVFHRASLLAFRDRLEEEGCPVTLITHDGGGTMERLADLVRDRNIMGLRVAEICDTLLEQQIAGMAAREGWEIETLPSPGFLTPGPFIRKFFTGATHYSMTAFYREQRKRLDILMEEGKPAGGKWTFDTENRKPLPKDFTVKKPAFPQENRYVREARASVDADFPDNPGSTTGFSYPVTHGDSAAFLEDFLARRFGCFGPYEDAISRQDPYICHSLLSPLLNTGLLTPGQVVGRALAYAADHEVPVNSLEGFIRQIIGWREYIRAIYLLEGENQRKANFWGFSRKMPGSFYRAATGLRPADATINRVMENAYAHHIERLMVLGNLMLLSGIHPEEVYRWFMELFIDAYDWVMVPNVFGMSQFADGGLITTKPYISGSRYLKKMGDYEDDGWGEIWDALYWHFIAEHSDAFRENPRMKVMVAMLDRMKPEVRENHREKAREFLSRLENG